MELKFVLNKLFQMKTHREQAQNVECLLPRERTVVSWLDYGQKWYMVRFVFAKER